MRSVSIYRLRELLEPSAGPCLSLYQPTHRSLPDRQQDPIRYRNLVAELERSLLRLYPKSEAKTLLAPFQALIDDRDFWIHAQDGLAVLGWPGGFRAYKLQRPAPEMAVAADSLHLKPLVRFVQSADRYHVLCLNRGDVKLYEGNRDALDAVELAAGIPRSSFEARGADPDRKPGRTNDAYGPAGQGGSVARGGHGSEKDAVEIDAERFFRAVDRGVLVGHSRPSGLPLVLVSTPENQEIFRRISHNPGLLADGVKLDPGSLGADRLREEAWKVVQPHYVRRLERVAAEFKEAESKFLGSSDPADVARAAVAGRVDTLLVDGGKVVPGRLDLESGAVAFGELADPRIDDLLDDLAELVLRRGGEVIVAPSDQMPAPSGAAAIYRF